MCLIFKWKGWEDGFIPENIEIEFQKSQLTSHLLFLVVFCFCCCWVFLVVFFFFIFKKQPLRVSFLKNRCSCISITYKYNSRSGWGFSRMSVRGLVFSWVSDLVCCLTRKWVFLGHLQKSYLDFGAILFF